MKLGKNVKEARAKVDRDKFYPLAEALVLATSACYAKFSESVDVSFNLNVNPRHADQMVRGAVVLPHGLGKEVRVLVFAKGDKATEATDAGADTVGGEDLVAKIKGGWLDFDKCIATPDMMRYVGQVGKVLGPRGLMPNPKVGTVTMDITRAVTEAKSGRLEFRVDKSGILHAPVGRVEFSAEQLLENTQTLVDMVTKLRPASVKGGYLKRMNVSTTMGVGVRVDVSEMD
ncbi:MAG TPA: 50S ribosomal protein L1 [Myxococcales bacterium]|nr:50S ribosomal protein L1 [Myxococcales bacterium]